MTYETLNGSSFFYVHCNAFRCYEDGSIIQESFSTEILELFVSIAFAADRSKVRASFGLLTDVLATYRLKTAVRESARIVGKSDQLELETTHDSN